MPALLHVLFELKGRLQSSPIKRTIIDGPDNFVNWRNRVFGHGVFKQVRQWYADETNRWLPGLHEFYVALRPVLEGWALISMTPNGDEIFWQG